MRVALISTLYNEENSVEAWSASLRAQTVQPDEFVIVDGGSRDQTVRRLEESFDGKTFPKPKIIVQRCNIAEGRNIAIRNTTADVIASIDGGSKAEPRWLEELTKPFADPTVGAVGGASPLRLTSELSRKIVRLGRDAIDSTNAGDDVYPSSRNVAFRREAWESVGGYPEWLTLTAEDMLFNHIMHYAGVRFYYQPSAVVSWEGRPDLRSFLRMMRSYGFGCGEVRMAESQFWRWLISLVPPVILFGDMPWEDVVFRYRTHLSWVRGFVAGRLMGRKPPAGWQRIDRVWISPEAIAARKKSQYGQNSDRA